MYLVLNNLKRSICQKTQPTIKLKRTFTLFVFIPCQEAKVAGGAKGGSTMLAIEAIASPLAGGNAPIYTHIPTHKYGTSSSYLPLSCFLPLSSIDRGSSS